MIDFHRRTCCTNQGRGMSKSKVASSNRLERRAKTGHPPDGIRFALCRATDGKALDRKPVAGQWDSVRAGSAWHSRANHDVQDGRVPVSRLDREEDSSVSWVPAETFFQPELRLAVKGKAGGMSLRSGRVPWPGG